MRFSYWKGLKVGFCLTVVGVIISLLFWWWQTQRVPMTAAQAFVDALNRQDWTSVTKFIHPTEQQTFGLTPEKVKFIGERLIVPIQQRLGSITELKRVENPFIDTPEEEVYFRDIYFFRLMRKGEEGAMILIVRTGEGWRVNFSMFIYTLLMEAVEKRQVSRGWALTFLRQVGISRLFVGKESMPLPSY